MRTAHAPSRPAYCRIAELLFSNFSNRRAKRKWPFLCGISCFFNLKYFRAGEADGEGGGRRQHSKLIYHNKRGELQSGQVNTPGQVDDWPQSTHTETDWEGERKRWSLFREGGSKMPSPVDRDCGYLFSSNVMDPPAIAWSSLAKGSPRFYWNIFHHFLARVAAHRLQCRTMAGSVWGFGFLDFWDFRELSIHKSCH